VSALSSLLPTPYKALRALKKLRLEASHELERLIGAVDLVDDDTYVEVGNMETACGRASDEPGHSETQRDSSKDRP
jgi:hypothetical protein